MNIRMQQVTKKLPEYHAIRQLYKTAFPSEERVPFWFLMLKAPRDHVDFWAMYSEDGWMGLAYVITDADLAYVFYLAIADNERGKGYGSQTLSALKEQYKGRRLFLAIEEMDERAGNYDERLKRRQFYEKNGLSMMAGCKMREGKVIYDVMGIGQKVLPQEYKQMMTKYLGRIFAHYTDLRDGADR